MFRPSDELTFDTVQIDRKRLLKYVQSPDLSAVRLDLSHVTQCDSAGLALLIEAKRVSKKFNKLFKIMNMPETICALAEFCGVEAMLRNDNE